ncbi:MAG: hypothetical protein JOZ04_13795 [Acidimicrobiia bacterium]|nr:hypothetical protein [Acidimicrobiia bacterium]
MTSSISFDRIADRYDETRGGERRGQLVAAEIDPYLGPGARILEIGVGTGIVATALAPEPTRPRRVVHHRDLLVFEN